MRLAVVVLSVILIFATSALPAGAAEFGTREEAAAMVRRVQEKFKKDGPEATFRAINKRAAGVADRDLYPFVTEGGTGLFVANGVTPAVTGKILIDLKDQDGRFIIQEIIKIAATAPGHGWIDYLLLKTGTKTNEDKTALIEGIDKYYVVSG